MENHKVETVIIGGGPAGLAAGACLKRRKRPFILLEQSDRIGPSWHKHYNRLHLHTDKKRSELPFFPYPDSYPKYPSRRQVIDYLEDYRHFRLQPRFNEKVVAVRRENGYWHTRTLHHRYVSDNVVVATGFNNRPHIPLWPGMKGFKGEILHSSEYRTGRPFHRKNVLVVGFGNSGGEIALDLCEYEAETSVSVRSPVNIIPRDLLGLPILAIAIPLSKLPPRLADLLTAPLLCILFGNIVALGLKKPDFGPFEQIAKQDRIPLIDVGTIKLIQEGRIKVKPGIDRLDGRGVVFTDGTHARFDAVVLATGFRPALEMFLEDYSLKDKDRAARDRLFFCGFEVTATGVLREIAIEARQIANRIAKSGGIDDE